MNMNDAQPFCFLLSQQATEDEAVYNVYQDMQTSVGLFLILKCTPMDITMEEH